LQDKFLDLTRKRKKFPLRVPLCFFFEYLGYSGLLKYLPYLRPISQAEELTRVLAYLRKAVEDEYIGCYECTQVGNRNAPIYMVAVKTPYKITHTTKSLEIHANEFYGPTFLQRCRNKAKSTHTSVLEE
jgi:hypothetical protein